MDFAARRERLRKIMAERSLDTLLVSYASNRYYLSGFELHDVQINESAGHLVITRNGRDYLCTDSRYLDAARRLWPEDDIRIYSGNAAVFLNKLLKELGGTIGFEAQSVSAAFAAKLCDGLDIETADGCVEGLRLIKEPEEVAALEKSFALNNAMLKWVHGELVEGMTEMELAWKIEKYFREHGASELAFPSIVAFGANGALPHAVPGSTKLTPETSVLLDVGCRVDSYCSDQTRTFWFGEHEDAFFARTRDLVAEAQQAALKGMRPGVILSDATQLARSVFQRERVDAYFTHGLGHGVGLDTHEAPSLNSRTHTPLEAGMTVTVEPGLYYSGKTGVRLEYTTLICKDGLRIL